MRITLTHECEELRDVEASVSGPDGTFFELVQQFKQCAMAIGYQPDTVMALQCPAYPEAPEFSRKEYAKPNLAAIREPTPRDWKKLDLVGGQGCKATTEVIQP